MQATHQKRARRPENIMKLLSEVDKTFRERGFFTEKRKKASSVER